jgi:prolycopene isomerase
MLDEFVTDTRLRGFLSMTAAGMSAPPSVCSAVIAGLFYVNCLQTVWMPKGGFTAFGVALAELFQEAGGVVATDAEVSRILIEDGRASGIQTEDGRRFTADAVVSACDARRTFLQMLPPEVVPADLRKRLPDMGLTPSIFQVMIGVDMDLTPYRDTIGQLNFIYPYDNIDRAMAQLPNGNVEDAVILFYPESLNRPELAPPGKAAIKLESYTTLDSKGIDWERDKERIADSFIRRTERLLPGLSERVVTRVLRTPLDLKRDTANPDGAFAGWAWTPELLSSRTRPGQRSPGPGRYLAGHWTTPTAGVSWVMLSGYNTAGMVAAELKKRRTKAARRARRGG